MLHNDTTAAADVERDDRNTQQTTVDFQVELRSRWINISRRCLHSLAMESLYLDDSGHCGHGRQQECPPHQHFLILKIYYIGFQVKHDS